MYETTDIEKKSLEAHAELCAERYSILDSKITKLEEKMISLETMLRGVSDMLQNMNTSRNEQLMTWTTAIIAGLVGVVGWLLANYVFK